jgi:hypothetical protein
MMLGIDRAVRHPLQVPLAANWRVFDPASGRAGTIS